MLALDQQISTGEKKDMQPAPQPELEKAPPATLTKIGPSLPVSEIFLSLQGETSSVGFPTVFVRLWGCNLRCPLWPCDSLNSVLTETKLWQRGREMAMDGALPPFTEDDATHTNELLRGFVAGLYDHSGDLLASGSLRLDVSPAEALLLRETLQVWGLPHYSLDPHVSVVYLSGGNEQAQKFFDIFRPDTTPAAFKTWRSNWQGDRMAVNDIVVEALRIGRRSGTKVGAAYATITGGEPTIHGDHFFDLAAKLASFFHVNVETNGSRDLRQWLEKRDRLGLDIRFTVDMKPPGSGESSKMLLDQYGLLSARDEIKVVTATLEDAVWAAGVLAYHEPLMATVLVSPVFGSPMMDLKTVAEWLLAHRPTWRLQTQLHKQIWPNTVWGV